MVRSRPRMTTMSTVSCWSIFPKAPGFGEVDAGELTDPKDLPVADVAAFSIDDVTTTEIDDAFSVTPLTLGSFRIGIHIAIPTLGIAPGSLLGYGGGTASFHRIYPGK